MKMIDYETDEWILIIRVLFVVVPLVIALGLVIHDQRRAGK